MPTANCSNPDTADHTLKGIIKKKFGGDATLIGDEGGFAPPCDARQGVELIMEAIEKAGYSGKCKVGMDVAASEFKVEGEDCYDLGTWYPDAEKTPELKMTGKQLGDFYASLCKDFPIITIEDPFDQDDWAAWATMTSDIGEPTQIVGDDLTVTNVTRVKKAIDDKACNALLLKVNQIGTITESIDAVKMCKQSGWGVMCSHRSGETEDTTIADLAVGLCTGQIKTGAPCRSDRNAKYNQLMRIEEELGADAVCSVLQTERHLNASSLLSPLSSLLSPLSSPRPAFDPPFGRCWCLVAQALVDGGLSWPFWGLDPTQCG